MTRADIENFCLPLVLLPAYHCWHLVNHTRRDQKSNVPAQDEALEKSNKNEK